MWLLIFLLISYVLLSISLFFLFPKAGEAGWKGLVPLLNFATWCKIVGRPIWYVGLLLIPIVNIFIYATMTVDMVRSFGKYLFYHSAMAVLAAPFYFLYLAFSNKDKYVGKTVQLEKEYKEQLFAAIAQDDKRKLKKLESQNPFKKSSPREWTEAILFAVIAATFIRMFLIEAYVIPTPSMEGSLLVGDFLFVSKANYGIRTPKTIAMLPLVHNRIPYTNIPSYLQKPSLPFYRFPALETVDRNDPVVFNYPEGDSVYFFPERTWSINDFRRGAVKEGRPDHHQKITLGRVPITVRPIDKKDHYIKRCVAIAGDSIQIIDRQLYINGKPAVNSKYLQYIYIVRYPAGTAINRTKFEEWGISDSESVSDIIQQGDGFMVLVLSDEQKAKVQSLDTRITIEPAPMQSSNKIFPHDLDHYKWTVDNFGPLYIPKKGATVTLTPESLAPYRRVIAIYEGNNLEVKNNQIFINGVQTNQYTFKMDYYWMMGDNRHNSEDSRIWGFVPEDHIVGKPLFLFMSTKDGMITKGINWNRIFSSADKK